MTITNFLDKKRVGFLVIRFDFTQGAFFLLPREDIIMQLCQSPSGVYGRACQDPEKGAVGDGGRWRFLERLKIRAAQDVLRNKMAASDWLRVEEVEEEDEVEEKKAKKKEDKSI